jgi:ferrous iron transport protein B
VFNLLCAPCFAAIGAIRREMNSAKWTFIAIGYQTGFAYLAALCVYRLGLLFTAGAFGAGTVAAGAVVVLFLYLLFRPARQGPRKAALLRA